MGWVKSGLNAGNAAQNANSITFSLSVPPPTRSVVMVQACYTGNPGTVSIGDGFNSTGSWQQIAQQVGTDQFGNAVLHCTWYRILAAAAAQGLISVNSGNLCQINAQATCWQPNEATSNVSVSAAARTGSGQASQPVCNPETFAGFGDTGFGWSCVLGDVNATDTPSDPYWTLVAETNPYGSAMQMAASTGIASGAGSTRWTAPRPNWLCSGIQFSYTRAPGPPIIVSNPAIVGTPALGVASSYTPGSASANGSTTPTETSHRWYVAGVQVSTAATYTPIVGDVGKALTVQVTWTNGAGTTLATSPGKTIQSGVGGPWTVGAAAFIAFQDTAALTTVGSFATAPVADSVVWCAAVCRSGTAGAGITCAVTDNFGDTGGTPWQLVQSANSTNDTTFVFWRIRGTGGTGRAMTATWGGAPSANISRSSVTGFNYQPPGTWATVEMIDAKTYNTVVTTPTTMPNFAALSGDFLLSYLAISGSATSTPSAFTSVIQGAIAGTGTTNGHGAIRNVSAGASENPNFSFATGQRVCLVAGQFRTEAAPPPGTPYSSAWLGYVAAQGGI